MSRIKIIRRDSQAIRVQFTTLQGVPINLNGVTVLFTVKRKVTDVDTDAVIKQTVTNHLNEAEGRTILPLAKEQTDIRHGIYFYDFELVKGEEVTSTIKQVFEIGEDVTIRVVDNDMS